MPAPYWVMRREADAWAALASDRRPERPTAPADPSVTKIEERLAWAEKGAAEAREEKDLDALRHWSGVRGGLRIALAILKSERP